MSLILSAPSTPAPQTALAHLPAPRAFATYGHNRDKKKGKTQINCGLLTVHSFRTLLENLGTLTKVICRPRIKGVGTFLKYPRATPLQKETFDLLGLKLPGA